MIKCSSISHVGNKYRVNEDSVGWSESRGLYFVADGMGGHAGGEVASGIASQTLLSPCASGSLLENIMQAHRAIFEAAEENPKLQNMGSTVVASKIEYDKCELCWVGDSRAYLWRDQRLEQLTEDHSLVQVMLNRGEIGQDEARSHEHKNVVVQILGINTPMPGRVVLELQPGDWLLLCSDGLTDELDDSEISATLASAKNISTGVTSLLDAALSRVGRDNISIMILRYSRYNRMRLLGYVGCLLMLATAFWAI